MSLLTIQVDAQLPNLFCILFPNSPQCTNTNPNSGQSSTTTTTNPPCCPFGGIWSSWRTTSQCSDQCGGFGTKTMERYCLTEGLCGQCAGPKTKTVACNFTPCQFPRMSCNSGYSAKAVGKQIMCTNGQSEDNETLSRPSCCPLGGLLDIWSDFDCSNAECGSCTPTKRTQRCRTEDYGCGPCIQLPQTENRYCMTAPCKFPQQSCCSPFVAKPLGDKILCQ
ncbi:Thrombospondin, type 1 repeat-containing protein [Aphelenchoides besseyi]|nr:Thrombospondin, type 1 repeat-containing protein [Aphelenchoides besseyi]